MSRMAHFDRPASAFRRVERLALSRLEAAQALGVSVDFLEDHVLHELRVVRCGRRRLIPVREFERWIEAHAAISIGIARVASGW